MAKFFVGQRVRIARPDLASQERGLVSTDEGVISEIGVHVDYRVSGIGKINPYVGKDDFPCFDFELQPLQGQQIACDAEFKESLDKLLDGLPA